MRRQIAVLLFVFMICSSTFAFSTSRKLFSSNLTQCRCATEETFVSGLNSGVFKSPGFPRNYCNNLNCHWNIMPLEGSFVGAILNYFETELRFDVLEVYQTWWNNSMLSAKQAILHGSFDPRTMERQFFSSVGGGLMFRFISDNTDNDYHGFQITFRRYSKGYTTIDDRSNSPCPMPFHHSSSQIQMLPVISPNFHLDSSCIFTIDSNDAVNFTITHFLSSILSLEVYETENFQVRSMLQKPLTKIEPGIVPILPISLISRTNSFTVLINTKHAPFSDRSAAVHYDHVQSQSIYEFQFSDARSMCACPPSQLVVSRLHPSPVTSPGYPLEYCDSANCTITATLEGPRQKGGNLVEGLRIRILDFQTEPDQDYINFWNENGRSMLVMSFEARNIRHLTFDRPQLSFSFITDHSIVDTGFNMSIEAFKKESECVCPTLSRTLLQSRSHYEENSFDKRKCQFMDCFWFIDRPTSSNSDAYHRILLKVNHTITGPSDFILIAEGAQMMRNPFIRKLDSMSYGTEVAFEFEDKEPISIWFHRESPTDEQMMEATAEENGGDGGRVEVNFAYEWREVCLCGADEFKADTMNWHALRSPDFPHTYCRNMRCQWKLNAPEGYHLSLNITSFFTEADQDFLYIFDGNDTTQKHKEILSGPHYGATIVHSEKNVMTLLFISDGSIQEDGFELCFRAEANPGTEELTNSSGHFPKTLVFFLFFILASTGAIFLFTRSQRIGTFDGIVTNSFDEGFVRFFRRPNQSFATASSANNNISSVSNPFFSNISQ